MSAASKVGLIAICLGGVVAANTPGPQAPKKLLFLTHAGLYKHTSLGPAEMAVASWGEEAGYEVTSVQGYLQEQEELDLSIITAEYLAQFDGVMMMGCKHGDDYQCHARSWTSCAKEVASSPSTVRHSRCTTIPPSGRCSVATSGGRSLRVNSLF